MSQSPIYLDINNNKSVITALKAGEEKVFDVVYRHYFRRLCAFCSQYVSEQEEIEEIVQETMMWLWENRCRRAAAPVVIVADHTAGDRIFTAGHMVHTRLPFLFVHSQVTLLTDSYIIIVAYCRRSGLNKNNALLLLQPLQIKKRLPGRSQKQP